MTASTQAVQVEGRSRDTIRQFDVMSFTEPIGGRV